MVALTTALSKLSDISSTESTTTIHSTCAIPANVPLLAKPYHAPSARQTSANRIGPRKKRSTCGLVRLVGLFWAGERPRTHIRRILLGRRGNGLGDVAERLYEAGRALEHAEHVVGRQDLPVALRRRADADRRAGHRVGDRDRKRLDHAFDHYRERAGAVDRLSIADDLGMLRFDAPARAVAAEHIHRLRGEADVPHHRTPALHEKRARLGHGRAAFELHRGAAGL